MSSGDPISGASASVSVVLKPEVGPSTPRGQKELQVRSGGLPIHLPIPPITSIKLKTGKPPELARKQAQQIAYLNQTIGVHPTDQPIVKRVTELTNEALKSYKLPAENYEIIVLDSDEINASFDPNFLIIEINWGLIEFLERHNLLNSDTLKFLIGHEIGHALIRAQQQKPGNEETFLERIPSPPLVEEYKADEYGLFALENGPKPYNPIAGMKLFEAMRSEIGENEHISLDHPHTERRETALYQKIITDYWHGLHQGFSIIPETEIQIPRTHAQTFTTVLYQDLSWTALMANIAEARTSQDFMKLQYLINILFCYDHSWQTLNELAKKEEFSEVVLTSKFSYEPEDIETLHIDNPSNMSEYVGFFDNAIYETYFEGKFAIFYFEKRRIDILPTEFDELKQELISKGYLTTDLEITEKFNPKNDQLFQDLDPKFNKFKDKLKIVLEDSLKAKEINDSLAERFIKEQHFEGELENFISKLTPTVLERLKQMAHELHIDIATEIQKNPKIFLKRFSINFFSKVARYALLKNPYELNPLVQEFNPKESWQSEYSKFLVQKKTNFIKQHEPLFEALETNIRRVFSEELNTLTPHDQDLLINQVLLVGVRGFKFAQFSYLLEWENPEKVLPIIVKFCIAYKNPNLTTKKETWAKEIFDFETSITFGSASPRTKEVTRLMGDLWGSTTSNMQYRLFNLILHNLIDKLRSIESSKPPKEVIRKILIYFQIIPREFTEIREKLRDLAMSLLFKIEGNEFDLILENPEIFSLKSDTDLESYFRRKVEEISSAKDLSDLIIKFLAKKKSIKKTELLSIFFKHYVNLTEPRKAFEFLLQIAPKYNLSLHEINAIATSIFLSLTAEDRLVYKAELVKNSYYKSLKIKPWEQNFHLPSVFIHKIDLNLENKYDEILRCFEQGLIPNGYILQTSSNPFSFEEKQRILTCFTENKTKFVENFSEEAFQEMQIFLIFQFSEPLQKWDDYWKKLDQEKLWPGRYDNLHEPEKIKLEELAEILRLLEKINIPIDFLDKYIKKQVFEFQKENFDFASLREEDYKNIFRLFALLSEPKKETILKFDTFNTFLDPEKQRTYQANKASYLPLRFIGKEKGLNSNKRVLEAYLRFKGINFEMESPLPLEEKLQILNLAFPHFSIYRDELILQLLSFDPLREPLNIDRLAILEKTLPYLSNREFKDLIAHKMFLFRIELTKTRIDSGDTSNFGWPYLVINNYQELKMLISKYFQPDSAIGKNLLKKLAQKIPVSIRELSEEKSGIDLESLSKEKQMQHWGLELLGDHLKAQSFENKSIFFKWLMGFTAVKPPITEYFEFVYQSNLDDLPIMLSLMTPAKRYLFLTSLFLGDGGLFQSKDEFKQLLRDIFQKVNNGIPVSEDDILWIIFQEIFEQSPDLKKFDLINGIFEHFLDLPVGLSPENSRNLLIKNVLTNFGVVGVKFGQILSKQGVIRDEALKRTLEELSDRVPPLDKRYALAAIEKNHSLAELEEQIVSIDDLLGSASVKQGYVINFKDGSKAVLKFIKPQARYDVAENMKVLRRILNSPKIKEKYHMPPTLLDEIDRAVHEEIDMEHEIENQRDLAEYNHQQKFDDPKKTKIEGWSLVIPRVRTGFQGEAYFADDYCQGEALSRDFIEHDQEMMKSISKVILKVIFDQIFNHGLYHADLHGGNFLVNPKEKKVFLLDFGNCRQMSEENRKLLIRFARSFDKSPEKKLKIITQMTQAGSGFPALLQEQVKKILGNTKTKFDEQLRQIQELIHKENIDFKPDFEILLKVFDTMQYIMAQLSPGEITETIKSISSASWLLA